ncbi:hypothetical protein DRO54_01665 [Candidatus Bathyarchaeota archaeon]|nr:MAG: hypothetical protein DRO54_01665 [Candidatus Bathyarchaeota archaeon]
MRKVLSLVTVTLFLLLTGAPFAAAFEMPPPPSPPPPPEEINWVSLMGMVQTYNGEPAYGLLKVEAKIGEWARAFAFIAPGETVQTINETWHHEWENFTYSFIFIKLDNASIVELNYTGLDDFYVEGLWSVYSVTISYVTCGDLNITLVPIYEAVTGNLIVSGGWSIFTMNISEITVDGIVMHVHYFSAKFVRCDFTDIGDENGEEVNVFDLMVAAKAYGKVLGMYEYDQYFECDLNGDFQIDIYDLLEICSEFEQP